MSHPQGDLWSRIPIDTSTELLLAFSSRGMAYRNEIVEELEHQLELNRMSRNDSGKLAFMLMVYFHGMKNTRKASRLFRHVEYDPVLGSSAIKLMETINE